MSESVKETETPIFEYIQQEIADNPVLLFMKGSPMFPRCGFSAAVVQVFSELDIKFKGIDVLLDMEIREGIKQFSDWPTIPQLYINGTFVGGCDIVLDMAQSGELKSLIEGKQRT